MATYSYYGTSSLADLLSQLGQSNGTGTAADYQRAQLASMQNIGSALGSGLGILAGYTGTGAVKVPTKPSRFIDALRAEIQEWHKL